MGDLRPHRAVRCVLSKAENTIIAAAGVSCRQQIRHGTGRPALHPLEVILQALRPRSYTGLVAIRVAAGCGRLGRHGRRVRRDEHQHVVADQAERLLYGYLGGRLSAGTEPARIWHLAQIYPACKPGVVLLVRQVSNRAAIFRCGRRAGFRLWYFSWGYPW